MALTARNTLSALFHKLITTPEWKQKISQEISRCTEPKAYSDTLEKI